MLAEQVADSWTPSSELEKAAVQQQLEKLLATPLFNSSKRYPSFLKFVVTRSLAGQTDQLKERILGMEIFGRPADYDTNTDPIVRVTAAEIRKRIEQYYQDPKHSQEIRLYLPAGSYAPQYSWPGRPTGLPANALALPGHTEDATLSRAANEVSAESRSGWFLGLGVNSAVALLLLLGLASMGTWYATRPPALKQFWEPFVKSSEPVLFCIADQIQYSTIRLRDAADPQREITLNDSMVTIIIDDVSPLVNLAGLLRTYGKTYRVQGEATTSLTDLRRGPSVFIGAFDNGWTLRLTSPLRFHFANDPDMKQLWIEDRSNPGKREWMLDRSVQQQIGTYKDYAIVARMVDPDTDQFVVVAAGISRGGTVAAGEFLVDANRMDEMLKQVPRNWKQKNVEIVLETQVIQGRSGPPRIAAVHVW
ncbi:MAG TPA: hypothetical protein VK728_16875 [Candidatus Sulfotelmatobacter sp.]|nr:hypothetical protein [Candidatus Sulfotelmatobacter sp.]